MPLEAKILVAIAAGWLSCVLPVTVGIGFLLSLPLSIIWIVMAVKAIGTDKLGWWTMAGLPALYWPFWIVAITYACEVHNNCL